MLPLHSALLLVCPTSVDMEVFYGGGTNLTRARQSFFTQFGLIIERKDFTSNTEPVCTSVFVLETTVPVSMRDFKILEKMITHMEKYQ